jgi:bifunctional non-homologous end joining protein LigD
VVFFTLWSGGRIGRLSKDKWAGVSNLKEEVRYLRVEDKEIKISNPDKPLYPEAGITKWDYVLACGRLAPFLLKGTRLRPLTVIRYPHGIHGESFYQKNAPDHTPEWISTAREGDIKYILLNDVSTLVWLANLACMEFHVAFHQTDLPDIPPEIVFDLDPSVDDFSKVVETALLTREVLQRLELDGFIKTSGASGLQIHVPLERIYTYEQTRKVGKFIAHYLAEQHPRLVTVTRQVKRRGDKVYFDYLQHWRGKTLIAPYSPRANPAAAVATPLLWEEVTPDLVPSMWNLHTIFPRLEQKGDLFDPLYIGPRYRLDQILAFIEKRRL